MTTLAPFAGALTLILACILITPRKTRRGSINSAAAHSLTQTPLAINYTANPYRVGAYVYVMEQNQPSDLDWAGTYIGMQDGMALIRDADTRIVTHVNRDQLYGAQH